MKAPALLGSLLALGAVMSAASALDYSKRDNIYSGTELRPIPYARFINVEALRRYKACVAKGQGDCKTYEFTAPYSLDSATVEVATKLRAAWQRLEDRYYWRAMTRLNNPAMVLTHCSIDWKSGQQAEQAKITLNVDDSMVPQDLAGKIPQQQPDDKMQLDRYGLFPQVPNTDYCHDLSLDLTIMYLPGTCVYFGAAKVFCIQGDQASLNPLAPNPIGFRNDLAVERIKKAVQEANTDYLKDYGQDVLGALTPTDTFFPLLWSSLSDAVVAPTMRLQPNLTFLKDKAQEAANHLGGVFQGTAYPYYLQGLIGPAAPLKVHLLPRMNDVLGVPNPPGVWKLEEFKRRFPVNNPLIYGRFGYTNLFQAWNEVRPRLLPEPAEAKPLRQMIYMASGGNIYLPNPVPVSMPAPMLIDAYAAGLPYGGPQTRFSWVSVAEGYQVPRVSGQPLGYGAITK